MTASSFNYVPGLPILTSKDLVNWRLVNYVLKNIPEPGYDVPRHACGVWRLRSAGMKLVYVESEGEAHRETVLQELDIADEKVNLRLTLLPTGYDEAVVTFEYSMGGEYHWIGRPFRPVRHTWVGARLALFSMSTDGQAHGGSAAFRAFMVQRVETAESLC